MLEYKFQVDSNKNFCLFFCLFLNNTLQCLVQSQVLGYFKWIITLVHKREWPLPLGKLKVFQKMYITQRSVYFCGIKFQPFGFELCYMQY